GGLAILPRSVLILLAISGTPIPDVFPVFRRKPVERNGDVPAVPETQHDLLFIGGDEGSFQLPSHHIRPCATGCGRDERKTTNQSGEQGGAGSQGNRAGSPRIAPRHREFITNFFGKIPSATPRSSRRPVPFL